jgi:PKHD-type hydroxylase
LNFGSFIIIENYFKMSSRNYFLGDHRTNINHMNYYYFQNGFSAEEVQKIIDLGESIPKIKATTVGSDEQIVSDYRISDISWIDDNPKSQWIYQKIADMTKEANREMWNFDIWDFYDSLQYTTYYGDGGHYDWHVDMGPGISNRKLSVVVQLSHPDAYEGGDLQFNPGGNIMQAPRGYGLVTIFPSFMLHRVLPLTGGLRRSLVTWLAGSNFR